MDTISPYTRGVIFAIWAAAALPMGTLVWTVVPSVAGTGSGPLGKALLVCSPGLVGQFLLVVAIAVHEPRRLRWSGIVFI